MSDLNARLLAHIKKDPALEADLMQSGASMEQAQKYANLLLSCMASGIASAGLPFPVTYSVGSPAVSGDDIEITGNLSTWVATPWGHAKREPNLTVIFNNGYSIDSEILPFGPWGGMGKMGRAMRSRGGLRYVQQIAADFEAKAPDGVSITYDSMYDGE